jgi:hypothetical protein
MQRQRAFALDLSHQREEKLKRRQSIMTERENSVPRRRKPLREQATDPLAPLLRVACESEEDTEMSSTETASYLVTYGVHLQEEYGELIDAEMKLSKDPCIRRCEKALDRLLDVINSINFASLVEPQGGIFGFFQTKPDADTVWQTLAPLLKKNVAKVRRHQKMFANRIEDLEKLKQEIAALDAERAELLRELRDCVHVGFERSDTLDAGGKSIMLARITSLQTTLATAGNERWGEMLTSVINRLIEMINDTLLTWVPIWLSTANETYVLVRHGQWTAEADAFQRLLEARNKILTVKGTDHVT